MKNNNGSKTELFKDHIPITALKTVINKLKIPM